MKVLRKPPLSWPKVALSIFSLIMVLRRRQAGWRRNMVAVPLRSAIYLALQEADRENVSFLVSLLREALGLPAYPHGLKSMNRKKLQALREVAA